MTQTSGSWSAWRSTLVAFDAGSKGAILRASTTPTTRAITKLRGAEELHAILGHSGSVHVFSPEQESQAIFYSSFFRKATLHMSQSQTLCAAKSTTQLTRVRNRFTDATRASARAR